MRIAVVGAGVAGPCLAYWLRRGGHEVTLVEQAPAPRTGGYVIDFWGVGYTVAERMGVLPRVRDAGYQVREVRLVDGRGRRIAGLPGDVFRRPLEDRFTSLPRSALSQILIDSVRNDVELAFDEAPVALRPAEDGVHVEFARAGARTFDLLIGADGLHSAVRRLAFAPQERFEAPLGYYVAAFEAPGYRPRDELTYVAHGSPGRQLARFALRGDRTLFLFVFDAAHMPGPEPEDLAGRKAALRRAFAGEGWEAPAILEALGDARDLYLDRMSQIRMPRWSAGRVALIGDAAACPSLLAGEGAGLGMAQAYVLAGELLAAGGDHAEAFAGFERRLRAFIVGKQQSAARFAAYFAPRTRLGLWFRNQVMKLMTLPGVGGRLVGGDLRDDLELPSYPF